MYHLLILAAFSLVAANCRADLMTCDDTRKCRLICYFPSDSARTDDVYPKSNVKVDRVIITSIGNDNLMYTSQRIDKSGPIATYHSLEAFILPKDYPCRLSPVDEASEAKE